MVPAARREGTYAVPNKKVEDENRYSGINTQAYAKYKTVELRMHSGSTNGVKITNWIGFLLAIVDAPVIKKAPTKVQDLKKLIGISDELANYIEARIEKFKGQNSKSSPVNEHKIVVEKAKEGADPTPAEASEAA